MTDTIRRADLTLDTWNGMVNRLERLYNRASRVCGADRDVQVMAVPNLDNAEKFLQDKSMPLDLPYVAVAPTGTEPNTQSYNAHVMRRWGVQSRLSQDGTTWSILKLVPVVVTFQVLIVCDDVEVLLRMMDRWNANELWGFVLSNERTNDDYRIKVQVQADKALQVPQFAPDQAGSDRYRLASSLRAQTYAGYVWQVPSIKTTELDMYFRNNDAQVFESADVQQLVLSVRHTDTGHAESTL